ncbi:MAG TPA: aspartyl/asparaginyl beta-hydroxylase domain-containing protein [Solirubrobacteraceae bacterium]|nr:aspartyl/asparaginyl beta-hydroxylase domain-containing protein [Solirubrobacteraceae bacterium]
MVPLDAKADAVVAFLRQEGAASHRHLGTATLLDHLIETYRILRRWDQPEPLALAGLLHSVYGTDAHRDQLLAVSRRDDVAAIAGERAEQLAYAFASTPRDAVPHAAPEERDPLVILHMANLAEQAQGPEGTPGRWLARLAELAEIVINSPSVRLPLFIAELTLFSEADESLTRSAYLGGLAPGADPDVRLSRLALAAATCPVVPEPCVWLAHLTATGGDHASARDWAGAAIKRQSALGTVWDKRLGFEEWLELAEVLATQPPPAAEAVPHPRALLEAIRQNSDDPPRTKRTASASSTRFHRYVESLAGAGGKPLGAVYPDLPSRPWYDPADFPIVGYLEAHFEAIRDEVLNLDASRFHRESERIPRSGDWDVAFFYERGRRHDEPCRACPVTTRCIEAYPTVRTLAGLIYASRMRGGTHISPHRGPTNLRVRCHLPLKVPEGDCAIRVGAETRRWEEGRCLVFDDFFEHEAWNHTDEERIVLIVDLWHPGLSPREVELLTGLHGYASAHADRLDRYWAKNAAAAFEAEVRV